MDQEIERLTEELRIKTKIITEIKAASQSGMERRLAVETDAKDLARLARGIFRGHRLRHQRDRAAAAAMLSIADRILSR
jgi:hypothetical protein